MSAPPRPYKSVIDRIIANVRTRPAPRWAGVRGPCWIWQGKKNARGYGWMGRRCKYRKHSVNVLVHRLVINIWHGIPWHEIPVGAHLCGNKDCCSPLHLEAQTEEENRRYYYDVEKPLREAVRERIPF